MPGGIANRKAGNDEFCGFIATEIFYGIRITTCSSGKRANLLPSNKLSSPRWFSGRLPAITNQEDAVMPGGEQKVRRHPDNEDDKSEADTEQGHRYSPMFAVIWLSATTIAQQISRVARRS